MIERLAALERELGRLGARLDAADVERGALLASVATEVRTLLQTVETLRRELVTRERLASRLDELTDQRLELMRAEIRRLDRLVRAQADQDDWEETTGQRELAALAQRAQESRRPPPPAARAQRRSSPDLGDALDRPSLDRVSLDRLTPAPPQPAPPAPAAAVPPAAAPAAPVAAVPPAAPVTPAGAAVDVVRVVFADRSVSVRLLAVLVLLTVALAALAFSVRSLLVTLEVLPTAPAASAR